MSPATFPAVTRCAPATGVRIGDWRVGGGWGTLMLACCEGPLIWLDENGEPNGHFDVFDYIKLCREHYEKVGIGAGYVDKLFR